MYFNTQHQLQVFSKLFLIGMVAGCVLSVCWILNVLTGKKKVVTFLLDFVYTLLAGGIYYLGVIYWWDGKMQWFTYLAFLLGILIQQKTIGKLVAKGFYFVYNKIKNVLHLFFQSKIGKIVTK